MKRIWILLIVCFCVIQSAYSQSESNILGSWILASNYETPDIIILRSDNKYFVYNFNSVNIESLGLKKNLHGYDILIKDAYTTMTEKGNWVYKEKLGELIFKDRFIIDPNSDFVYAYGNKEVLNFKLNKMTHDTIELCYKKPGSTLCDIYSKNWSYTDSSGNKVFYQEITKKFVGAGDKKEEILLSGYETELRINYNFLNESNELIVKDDRGEVLYSTKEEKSTNGCTEEVINLKGVIRLIFEVVSAQSDSKWKINVEIK